MGIFAAELGARAYEAKLHSTEIENKNDSLGDLFYSLAWCLSLNCIRITLSTSDFAGDEKDNDNNHDHDDHKGGYSNANPDFGSERQATDPVTTKEIRWVVIGNLHRLQSITSG